MTAEKSVLRIPVAAWVKGKKDITSLKITGTLSTGKNVPRKNDIGVIIPDFQS